MKKTWRGMTMIELLATLAILGILTAIAVPSFRALQGRQSLVLAQRNVQSALYRMQQLALASPDTAQNTYEIIGFGLGFNRNATSVGGCTLASGQPNDFLALYQFVRNKTTGVITENLFKVADPAITAGSPCGPQPVVMSAYPDTFTTLPKDVRFSTDATLPSMLVTPLQATGKTYGELCDAANCTPYTELLRGPATSSTLYLAHRSIKNPSTPSGAQKLCRSVAFSRNTTITIDSKIVTAGCL